MPQGVPTWEVNMNDSPRSRAAKAHLAVRQAESNLAQAQKAAQLAQRELELAQVRAAAWMEFQ